jgi:uncharacterized protein YigA (DUF484 family)
MDANEVARYLQNHPEFFEQYADLLAHVHIPSPFGGKAVSITERQVLTLRDKAKSLEAKMAELVTFGEENDLISEKVHRLAVALLTAPDTASVLRALYSHLGGAFAVPHVALRIWGAGSGAVDSHEFDEVGAEIKLFAATLKHPYCGPSAGQEACAWFGERGAHARSMAQIPLREHGSGEGACFGLLVFASEEAHRFYPEMGTLYLERIGDMASAALLRVVG